MSAVMPAPTSHVFDATTASFEADVLQASLQTPVLVDFWAEWCAPCKTLGPVLEGVAADYHGAFRLAKVDTEAVPALGTRFAIRSIPTLALFKGGREIARQAGAMGAADILRWVRAHGG